MGSCVCVPRVTICAKSVSEPPSLLPRGGGLGGRGPRADLGQQRRPGGHGCWPSPHGAQPGRDPILSSPMSGGGISGVGVRRRRRSRCRVWLSHFTGARASLFDSRGRGPPGAARLLLTDFRAQTHTAPAQTARPPLRFRRRTRWRCRALGRAARDADDAAAVLDLARGLLQTEPRGGPRGAGVSSARCPARRGYRVIRSVARAGGLRRPEAATATTLTTTVCPFCAPGTTSRAARAV